MRRPVASEPEMSDGPQNPMSPAPTTDRYEERNCRDLSVGDQESLMSNLVVWDWSVLRTSNSRRVGAPRENYEPANPGSETHGYAIARHTRQRVSPLNAKLDRTRRAM